jgi:hypothetical protein
MKIIITAVVLFFLPAIRVDAAMLRVVGVEDGRTLVVERDGARETIRLAGITVVDEGQAAVLLQWTVGTSWVLVEPQPGGGHFVYRSPDALFVNRELVMRGFARATQYGIEPVSNLRVTYLGEVDPAGNRPAARTTVSADPSRTDIGTSRRSSARPSRRTRSARARSGPAGPASGSRPRP